MTTETETDDAPEVYPHSYAALEKHLRCLAGEHGHSCTVDLSEAFSSTSKALSEARRAA